MKLEKHDLESAKMTVVFNIQAMQGATYATTSFGFDELWAMSLKELRELQDKLVKQYARQARKAIQRSNKQRRMI